MKLLRPLKPGGGVGVFAPGSPVNPERVARGIRYYQSLGYQVVVPRDPSEMYGRADGGFANGSVEDRLNTLYQLLEDEKVDVVIAARGAYGCLELLPQIDFSRIARSGKALVGYSDVSTLLVPLLQFGKISTIHGPTVSKEAAEATESAEAEASVGSLLSLLSEPDYRISAVGEVLRGGSGEGELVVSNLTTLVTLLGTPWEPDLNGKILVVEEVGEAPYRVHRLLLQLKLAGQLSGLQGLCFGSFYKCEAKFPPSLRQVWEKFIVEWLGELDFPVVSGLPCGHEGKNTALPLGVKARVEDGSFRVLEGVI